MKRLNIRIITICLLAVMAMTACGQQSGYTLRGTVSGLDDNTVLTLVPVSHDNEKPLAEATVTNGKFEFTGQREFPIMVRLTVKDCYSGTILMLENASINVEASVKLDKRDNGTYALFKDVKVTGSPLTDKLRGYQARRDSLDVLYQQYHERNKEGQELMMKARQSGDEAQLKAARENASWKAYEAEEHQFFQTVEKTFAEIINENKDTYWGPMMAIYLYSYFSSNQQELFNSFSKEAQESYYGEKMRDEVFPGGEPGTPAKELQVKDDNGKTFTLKQLCAGKKVVLIDFWASWCAPCRKEIPNVKAQYAKYKNQGFEVISISIDKNESAWRKALAEEKLEWPNFLDRSGAADVYKVRSIPAMFLIDAEKQSIIATGEEARGQQLATRLAELF